MADYLSSVLNEYGLGEKKDKEPSYLDSVLGEYGLGEQKAPASRNIAAVANDLVITGANAALGGAQAVSDFISPNNKFSQGVEELIKEGESKQSDVVKEGRRKLGQALDTEDIGTQLRGVKDFVLENPGQAAAMAAGSFAIPFGAIKGAKGASQLFGLGEKATSRVALGTGMTTSGVLAGGDAAGDAYQAVMNSPALADRTIEERERLASDAARKASAVPFVLGAASGLVGADRALATGTRSLLKTGAAEFASEFVEEGATKLSANIAADLAGAEVGTFRGVAGAAALGGVLGGGTGLAVGALTKQPDSLLAGSTNISSGQISPDENAVNKAIDANSSELTTPLRPTPTSLSGWPDQLLNSTLQFQMAKGREANVELIQQIDAEIARRGGTEAVDSQAQVKNAQLQQQQQAAQAQQQAAQAQVAQLDALRTDVFNKYGGQTTTLPGGTKPVFNFLGKQYFTLNDMNKAVDAVLAKEQTKPPMVREVEGALASVIPVVGAKPYTPAKMASFLNPYLNEAESIAEVADRIDARLANIKPNSPESDTLTALRNVLRGEPAEGNITQLNQGVNDGQLQQLQGNAGLRAVSEQGGATQTGGTGTGNVRPTGLQPVQPRSVDEGSLGLQVGAVPSGGVPTSTSADGSRVNIPNAGGSQAQDQGQVNGRQPQVSIKKRRSVVPDQAVERARSPEQQSEEEATNLVETVVKNVINAVVKRRGRMSNVNLEKLKEFIYYDFSQVENRKEGVAGLSKKELAEMFDVSTDTIDGWQDIANNFFEQNRGVIQAQLYQALDDSGMSLLELKEQIQATRENVLNDAITLEEGQRAEPSTKDDEQAAKTKVGRTVAAADQELTEVDESQLDQRELGAEDSGMSVMTGRKGASVQEQNKPEETINARYLRKSEELAAAEDANDQDLIEKLNKELDELADEAMGIAKKQVAKSEAIAGEKKGTKDAVQKRSTKGVSVRKQAEVSEGIPSKDTERGKAATEAKTDEKSRSLTVVENKQAEEQDAQTWNALPVPVRYEQLSPQAKADWALSVKDGKTNLAAASKVYDANEDNIIDGTDLITEVGEDRQIKLLTYQVEKLTEEQTQRLEDHYNEDRESNKFFQKLREDVLNYANKGAESVAKAIRDIIKSMQAGVMSMAVVFNPTMTSEPFKVAIPTYETNTTEIVAQVPDEAAKAMSPAAKRAYEVIYPAIKGQLIKNDKLFVVTDKPTATNFIFSPDGKVLFQSKVLIGKTEGNYYKGNNDVVDNRITPAGLYNMGIRTGGETAAGYDFNKVFGVEQVEDGSKYFITMMHSVYTKDSDASKRVAALKEAGPENSRYSFGCINVDKDTFGKILAGYEKQMDGAKLFIVPDGNENVMEFINGKAVYSSDMVREKVEPVTKTTKVPKQGTGTPEQLLAAREEKATKETTRLSFQKRKKEKITTEEALAALTWWWQGRPMEMSETLTEGGVNIPAEFNIYQGFFKATPAFIDVESRLKTFKIENALNAVNNFFMFRSNDTDGIHTIGVDPDGFSRSYVGLEENLWISEEQNEINTASWVLGHEIAHAVDDPEWGAVYSSQPEFNVRVNKKGKLPKSYMGSVMRELYDLYLTDKDFGFLNYPFDPETDVSGKDPEASFGNPDVVRGEVFAQVFAAMLDQNMRAIISSKAPETYSFMEDVFNDIKTTTFQRVTAEDRETQAIRRGTAFESYRGRKTDTPVSIRQKQTGVVLRRSLKKAREQSQKQMARLPKSVGGPLQALMDNIYGFAKKGLPTFAFTEDLADIASKLLPSAKKYVTLSKERDAIKTKFERQVDKVLQMYDKLPESVKGTGENSVNKLIKDFTMSGKWGYNPGWIKGGVTLDPELKTRFEAMPVEAQNMIKAVFTHGQNTLLTMQKSVTENINSEYDALIADAKKTGDKKEEAELTKKKAAALTDYSTLMRTNSKSPYAPLKRFGNYVVVGYSQQYLENEILANSKTATPDVVAEAKKKIRELEKNEDHYFVQFAETRGEARAIAREEEKNYALVDSFEKDQSNSYGGRDVQNMFYRLRNMVEESKDANLIDASEKAMNRLLADLHLTLLSEQSARQSERRRRKIAGAEDDMMRSFATQGRATANFIASLANTGSIYDVLREMKQEADARGGTSTREERRRYYNEFMKRQFMGMEYNPSPYVDKALSLTSMWMLLTNPAYYMQNMTQPFMMSLPVIGGKHGYTKSWKEFTKAYKEIFTVIKDGGLDEATYGKLPADVRSVVEELVNRGRIDISLEQDLGRWRSTEDAKLAKFGRASELLRTMAQNIETVNRVATAVAAYRLESKVSNPTRALNYADKIIYTTHGDYSTGNAPRFTREGIGRLATQFRKFQLIQISLMTRLFNDAFRSEDPDTRMIGKKALAFTIGHTAVVGGAMGLPGFYAVAALYGMLFGDEDEPDNPELALRRAIGNDTIADLLVKGVPAALGVDLSGKLGMGQMLSLFPYSNVDMSRKGVYELVGTAVTGPFGALLGKTAEGISYMGQGEYYKGVEQMLPTGLSNVAKAYRFATEGVTNRAGDVVLGKEEIDLVESMMTALGLPPKQITDRQFLQATKFEFDEFYNDKASEIKRAYTRASKENDTAAQAKAREDWKKLQESRAKNGYTKQPLSSLLKAPQEQRKRERNVAGGVQFNRANKGFVRQTSEL